jgi:hypothetical protein
MHLIERIRIDWKHERGKIEGLVRRWERGLERLRERKE